LRLTADGYLKPCLFSEHEVKVDMANIRGSILAAVEAKPQSGEACRNRAMSQIGG
jgi:molybdenum cofactor biosynthesis enzyme MoaA